MSADAVATFTAWATAAAAAAGFLAAVGTIALAWQTRRLADETRAMSAHEREQAEMLRRDRDLRLRPILEIHGFRVVDGPGPRKRGLLTVSNYGQGLAVNAYCVGNCTDEREGQRLARDYYVSVATRHIPPGADRREIEMESPVEGGLHAALLEITEGVFGTRHGGREYSVLYLDETGRTLHRFLFGQPTVDAWQAGEPPPPWAKPLLQRVPDLKPEGVDLNELLNRR